MASVRPMGARRMGWRRAETVRRGRGTVTRGRREGQTRETHPKTGKDKKVNIKKSSQHLGGGN